MNKWTLLTYSIFTVFSDSLIIILLEETALQKLIHCVLQHFLK